MKIGPNNWRAVSIGSSGVPRTAAGCNVERAASKLKKLGLELAYTHLGPCFFVYEKKGPSNYLCHFNFMDGEKNQIPITEEKINYFRWMKERFGRIKSKEEMQEMDAQAKRDAATEKRNASNKWWEDHKKGIIADAKKISGRVTPRIISIPNSLGRVS
jgi:hypothetical protein